MSRAYFHFACNDYRNGRNLHYFETAEFRFSGDIFIHLEGRPTVVRQMVGNQIRVGRHVFPFFSYQGWIGSRVWDRVEIEMADANKIAEYLRYRRGFKPDHATAILWRGWEKDEPLNFERLIKEVEREIASAKWFNLNCR